MNNNFGRVIKNRKISLITELKTHIEIWKDDCDFEKLPSAIKESFNTILSEISVQEHSADIANHYNTDTSNAINNVSQELRRFIAIWLEKFRELTGFECEEKISPAIRIKLKAFVENLLISGSSSQEYLEWFYDDFCRLENVKKYLPPTYIFVMKDWCKNKFFFEKKDELARRRGDYAASTLKSSLVEIANEMFMQTKDEELGRKIIEVADGKMPITNFKKFIDKFAKKFEFEDIILKLQKIDENR